MVLTSKAPSSSRSALVGPSRRLPASARLVSPKWKSTVRSARTHAPALRACVQIAPDRPSVAGTPADRRFGNGASDTSKINFKGVHQTGSTPRRLARLGSSFSIATSYDNTSWPSFARPAAFGSRACRAGLPSRGEGRGDRRLLADVTRRVGCALRKMRAGKAVQGHRDKSGPAVGRRPKNNPFLLETVCPIRHFTNNFWRLQPPARKRRRRSAAVSEAGLGAGFKEVIRSFGVLTVDRRSSSPVIRGCGLGEEDSPHIVAIAVAQEGPLHAFGYPALSGSASAAGT